MTHSSQAEREHALALTKIREWLASPKTQVFGLFGLAGPSRRDGLGIHGADGRLSGARGDLRADHRRVRRW